MYTVPGVPKKRKSTVMVKAIKIETFHCHSVPCMFIPKKIENVSTIKQKVIEFNVAERN